MYTIFIIYAIISILTIITLLLIEKDLTIENFLAAFILGIWPIMNCYMLTMIFIFYFKTKLYLFRKRNK